MNVIKGLMVFVAGAFISGTFVMAGAEHRGAQCKKDASCSGACTAHSKASQSLCPHSPGFQLCFLMESPEGTATWASCVDSNDYEDECEMIKVEKKIVLCEDAKLYNCGCANNDGVCGFVVCQCVGDYTGPIDLDVYQTCTPPEDPPIWP